MLPLPGPLFKKARDLGGMWKRRHFQLLADGTLRYFVGAASGASTGAATVATGEPKRSARLAAEPLPCAVEPSPYASRPHVLEAVAAGRTYVLSTSTSDELADWLAALRAAAVARVH